MTIKIYHNPKCKTSCAVLRAIRARGHTPIVVDYLIDPPGKSDLIELINLMRVSPWDLIRKKEAKEFGLKKDGMDLTALISTIAKNPALLEYPIVATSTRAGICKPADRVNDIVGHA